MSRENWIELVSKHYDYTLYHDGAGNYFLEVLSGGIATVMYLLRLNQDEVRCYQADGNDFIEQLARSVSKYPSKYSERIISQ